MKILIANLGSTSMKYRLFSFDGDQETLLAKGGLERVDDYRSAISTCLEELKESGTLPSVRELAAVGFKTVTAKGTSGCVELNDDVLATMEAYNKVAPAHNPPYIAGIRQFREAVPHVPLIGLFETAFYQWIPDSATRYGVPKSWHEAGVRRLGFHGASHKFIAERSAELLQRDDIAKQTRSLYVDGPQDTSGRGPLRVVSCHLGGSSSITGIQNGVAIGNSMGLSPQSGVPMNNRVGDIDVMALPYIIETTGVTLDQAVTELSQNGGLKGVSTLSNDIRDLQKAADDGHSEAQMAIDFFVYEIRRWIGNYMFQMGGLEALVFTAGIGENRAEIRNAVCSGLTDLGIIIDSEKNKSVRATEAFIQADHSKTKVLVIPTNEEVVVARETQRFLNTKTN